MDWTRALPWRTESTVYTTESLDGVDLKALNATTFFLSIKRLLIEEAPDPPRKVHAS